MKQLRFLAIISIAACAFILGSCNSGDDKKIEESTSDSLSEKKEMVAAPSGPTSIMIIRHKVANYAKWKPGYDGHDSARLANGLHSYVICRGIEDSNMVMVAMIMDDVNKAKAMAADPNLKVVMKKAGVVGTPLIDFLESVMNDTTKIEQTVRLMVRSKVKDWDVWKKSFDGHKQARMDAGLTDRVVAHTNGDTHNVTLVFAVADVARAKAFMNSDDLKNKMNEAGVEGPPDFFMYKIVQRY